MFLKKVTIRRSGKTYNYYKIVTSYRDQDGKPKHRVIQNLGALSEEDADRMRQIIKAQQDPDLILAKSSDVVVTNHWLYLPIVVLHTLWKSFKLDRFFSHSMLAEALVLNRCIDPLSKIHVVDWMRSTVLPGLYDENSIPDNFAVYRELDQLNRCESELQAHIHRQLKKLDNSTEEALFYDITSTYMEGSKCILSRFGYSRDHRPDREQIVIALLVTPSGSPFYWKVLDGNTQDITTLPGLVKELTDRFALNSCHLVFDRGMVSQDHLDLLEDGEMTYLSAMDKNEMACDPFFKEVMPEPATKDDYEQILAVQGFQPIDDEELFFVHEKIRARRRYVFSFDVSRFYEDIKLRSKRVKQFLTWIDEENASLAIAKKSRKMEALERKIKPMLSKRKLKSIMSITIKPIELQVSKKDGTFRKVNSFEIHAEIDKEKEREIQRRDGITCFLTNDHSMPIKEVVHKYRAKNKIEEAFREMKSQLSLRPVHLTRPERVKAHVSVCVLAYLLRNMIEIILRKANQSITSSEVLQRLKSCQLNEVSLKGHQNKSMTVTEMNQQQRQLIDWLSLESETKQLKVKHIIENLKKSM